MLLLVTLIGAAVAEPPPCTCAEARRINGWCAKHEIGYVAAVPIRSKLLFEALDAHGHEIVPETFECPTCRAAIESDGFCELHRIGFVDGLAYFSRLTYELARGRLVEPNELTCPVCAENAKSHGWCPHCGVGMVGQVEIVDPVAFEHVERAIDLLERANREAQRCEYCAVAVVTDTRCPVCRIEYRNGRALTSPADAAPRD